METPSTRAGGDRPKRLKCFYTNANSLWGKRDEFRERVRITDPHIIGVTETWLQPDIRDAEVAIAGYNLYRKDRQERGGGLALYIKDDLKSLRVLETVAYDETIWCKVGDEGLLVGLFYRSPASEANDNILLLQALDDAAQYVQQRHMLIMGDFNYPAINYTDYYVNSGPDTDAYKFFQKTQDLFLIQNIYEPTRVREGNVPSTLDYVFTDEENLLDDIRYEVPLGKSDHVCLSWELITSSSIPMQSNSKLNYWKGDYERIRQGLQVIDWDTELSGKDVTSMWNIFRDRVLTLVRKHIPVKTVKKRRKCEWMTRQTLKQIKQRANAWRVYRLHPTTSNYQAYKVIRNRVNRMVKADQEKHRESILRSFKGNPKRFYGYMRNLQTVKTGVSQLIGADGTISKNDSESAEILCNYYKEVFVHEDDIGMAAHEGADQSHDEVLDDIASVFSRDKILNKLLRLKPDKSAGPDDIHPLLMKECASEISLPLQLIYLKSFETGIIPQDWKLANITPIFKKGKRNDPGNYRPVSLTSVPGKVMESLVKDRMTEYYEEQCSLSTNQHGFTTGRSCLTNLLETFEAWTRILDGGFGLDVIFLDYRKAFDTVPHRRLLEKLRQSGIVGRLWNWIQAFLSDRKMRVGVMGSFSAWVEVLSGVPQGSVLGPLLFLIFVNDLPSWIANSIKMFADDTKIWRIISKVEDSDGLQQDLNKLARWSDKWLLRFNPEKCKVMHIGHSHPTQYYMEDNGKSRQLQSTIEEKDLGIYVTSDLKPSRQCAQASQKAMSVLGMIRRNFRRITVREFKILYNSYVRPHLEYCIQAWCPHLVSDITSLERVQRRATKLVQGLKNRPYQVRLKVLGLYSLEQRRLRGDLIEMYKILTGRENIDYSQFFTLAPSHHNTRGHSLRLYVSRSNLRIRQKFFSQRSVNDWNRLPQKVVDATSINNFKNRLDRYWQDMGV